MDSLHILGSHKALRGFTLVEMIVVLAIISIITAVVLSSSQQFDRSLVITDTAYTVALSIREAQVFGLSSRTYSANPNAAYGTHFIPNTTNYILFSDISKALNAPPSYCPTGTAGQPDAKPGNCLYDTGYNEVIQTFTLNRGFTISQVCGRDIDNPLVLHCSTDQSAPLTGIDVLFTRPNTDSIVTGLRNTGGNIQLRDATIVLTEPTRVGNRYICVSSVGQISVATTTCP